MSHYLIRASSKAVAASRGAFVALFLALHFSSFPSSCYAASTCTFCPTGSTIIYVSLTNISMVTARWQQGGGGTHLLSSLSLLQCVKKGAKRLSNSPDIIKQTKIELLQSRDKHPTNKEHFSLKSVDHNGINVEGNARPQSQGQFYFCLIS